jgi:redox-sensitive bicupin YhaK (pirin superfamily)
VPAITADTLTLPRISVPALETGTQRPVRSVTTAPIGLEGDGFPVRRAFAGVSHTELDPFIHMDQMGEIDWAPGEPTGTPWHPHRGFETVTYIIDGTIEHHDSHGGGGTITNGDTQWMTAGSGILHIERPPEHLVVSGGMFHGVQLWVNLPRASKFVTPRYQDIRANQARLLSSADGGALLRVIAGDVAGYTGPGTTNTPITVVHALTLAAQQSQSAAEPNLEVLLLGGRPLREPVVQSGPFVMNTREEIVRAYEDYQAGRFGVIPTEHIPHTG